MAIIRLGNCSNWLLGLWIPPPVAHPSSRTQGDCPGGDVFAGLKPLDFATTFHGEKTHGFRWKFSTKNQSPMIQQTMKFIEGSLEVKLPTIWRHEKAVSREKSQKRKDQKKEDAGARKGKKVAKHGVFSWFCGSGGLKSRLAKAAGAETSGEMRDEKLHAVVARSRFRSEKVQNTSASDHFWKMRCWKNARRCGAKQIWK